MGFFKRVKKGLKKAIKAPINLAKKEVKIGGRITKGAAKMQGKMLHAGAKVGRRQIDMGRGAIRKAGGGIIGKAGKLGLAGVGAAHLAGAGGALATGLAGKRMLGGRKGRGAGGANHMRGGGGVNPRYANTGSNAKNDGMLHAQVEPDYGSRGTFNPGARAGIVADKSNSEARGMNTGGTFGSRSGSIGNRIKSQMSAPKPGLGLAPLPAKPPGGVRPLAKMAGSALGTFPK